MSLTIFRLHEHDWIYEELSKGRLRQSSGALELNLLDENSDVVPKIEWEKRYEELWNEKPSHLLYTTLARMPNNLSRGEVVIIPNVERSDLFVIARVSEGYRFDEYGDRIPAELFDDYRHVVELNEKSIRIFHNRANVHAFIISGLFNSARYAVSAPIFDADSENAANVLLKMDSSIEENYGSDEIIGEVSGENYTFGEYVSNNSLNRSGCETYARELSEISEYKFDKEVRDTFRDRGYKFRQISSRIGNEVDHFLMVYLPTRDDLFLFEPTEILVKVIHGKGESHDDTAAIYQLVKWVESYGNNYTRKCVMSSAYSFTPDAQELAEKYDVLLICGLQMANFVFTVSNLNAYREDWEIK